MLLELSVPLEADAPPRAFDATCQEKPLESKEGTIPFVCCSICRRPPWSSACSPFPPQQSSPSRRAALLLVIFRLYYARGKRDKLIVSFLFFFSPLGPVGCHPSTAECWMGGRDYKTLEVFCITTLLSSLPLRLPLCSYKASAAAFRSLQHTARLHPHPQNNRLLSPPPFQPPLSGGGGDTYTSCQKSNLNQFTRRQ